MINDQQDLNRSQGMSRRKALRLAGAFATAFSQGAAKTLLAEIVDTQATEQVGRRIKIPAKPAPIEVDLSKTAVIVIDMQNDFVSKSGMLDRLGADISMIQRAVAPTCQLIAAARRLGMTIIYLKMAFKPDLLDVGPEGSPNWIAHQYAGVGKTMTAPDGRAGRILVRDTWNTEVVAELEPKANDIQIYKHRYSGFFETDLDARLKQLGVRKLLVTGCTTSVCVESTVRDAMFLDYSSIVLEDCVGEPLGNDLARTNHEASLYVIAGRNFGWVSSSAQVIESMNQHVNLHRDGGHRLRMGNAQPPQRQQSLG
ncbi:ureidoacrylate peracid hydrolase [Granulicella aggregans]|uniref:Ureidoacrylate peracid hydrolase n=1 Tax=Granulicella aggregans TaxID=474949 RepID=A0A7W7ZIG5_9BACT|nr:cysteine hydrolase [Granulicella aggregans]MBB5060488.1 ureidoacrylate peracid hydrolase [Granulicella aggregans]